MRSSVSLFFYFERLAKDRLCALQGLAPLQIFFFSLREVKVVLQLGGLSFAAATITSLSVVLFLPPSSFTLHYWGRTEAALGRTGGENDDDDDYSLWSNECPGCLVNTIRMIYLD